MVTIIVDPTYGLTSREMMDHLDRHGIDSRPSSALSSLPGSLEPRMSGGRANATPWPTTLGPRAVNLHPH